MHLSSNWLNERLRLASYSSYLIVFLCICHFLNIDWLLNLACCVALLTTGITISVALTFSDIIRFRYVVCTLKWPLCVALLTNRNLLSIWHSWCTDMHKFGKLAHQHTWLHKNAICQWYLTIQIMLWRWVFWHALIDRISQRYGLIRAILKVSLT